MSKSINIVFIKQFKEDEFGTLYIRTIEGRDIKKKSLKIKIRQTDWKNYFNDKTKRFREDKRFPQYEIYNYKIEQGLDELKDFNNDLDLISDDKKSFIDYWDMCIRNQTNHGTIIKHKVIKRKLEKYLLLKKKSNLLFKEITPIFLKELQHYLKTSKDPKSLSENSVIHYLKVIKSVINQSKKEDYYTYIKNPFNTLTFSKEKTTKNILNEEELSQLIKTKIDDDDELNKIRDLFLFQLFSNGMRVSDVLLSRWSLISDNRLNYRMFKTGTPISIPLNLNMGFILSRNLGIIDRYEKLCEVTTIDFQSNYGKPSIVKHLLNKYGLKQIDEIIDKHIVIGEGITHIKKKSVSKRFGSVTGSTEINYRIKEKEIEIYKGYKIEVGDIEIKKVIDKREELVQLINRIFIGGLMGHINKMNKKQKNDFIFPVLSKGLFKESNFENKFITLEQYKNIKHSTIVYNRKLKKLQEICKIETDLSSHVPRHTFTNLLLRLDNVNLYDISQSLGHTSIKTTEYYIRSGFNIEKIDYLNKEISEKYNLQNK